MNPLALYASIALALAAFAGGWTARDWKAGSDELAATQKAEKQIAAVRLVADTKAAEYEAERAKLDPARIEVRNTVREIYRNVKVPAECAAADATVSLLDATRRDANSAASGEPRGELPVDLLPARAADRPAARGVGGRAAAGVR